MDHFYIVPCASRPNVSHTGFVVGRGLGGNRRDQRLDKAVGLSGTTRHQAGAIAGPFLTPGHAHADKAEIDGFQFSGPALSIGKIGIAPVDNNVTLIQ
jgi:hypothetical protein